MTISQLLSFYNQTEVMAIPDIFTSEYSSLGSLKTQEVIQESIREVATQSASTKTPTKTLFEYSFDFWNSLSVVDQLGLELVTGSFILGIIAYFGILILMQNNEKKTRRYIVKFKFSNLEEPRTNYGDQFTALFSQIHTLAKGSVSTFEIHKQNHFTGFVITTTRKELAKRYVDFLFQFKGLIVEQATDLNYGENNVSDPLTTIFDSNIKPFQHQLITSMEFGNLHKDEFETAHQLTTTMNGLIDIDFASVVIAFRPQHYKEKIKARISKLNYQSQRKSKKYGHDSSYSEEIKQLQIKNQTKMFTTRITILASSNEIIDNLAVAFNNLEAENYFKSNLSNYSKQQVRFVPSNNPLRLIFKKPFGSLVNCHEISAIAQVCNFGNPEIIKNSTEKRDYNPTEVHSKPNFENRFDKKFEKTFKPTVEPIFESSPLTISISQSTLNPTLSPTNSFLTEQKPSKPLDPRALDSFSG